MRETNHKADARKAEAAQATRQNAENGAAQAKETYAQMSAAAVTASGLIQASCTTAAQGAAEYNAKVIQISHTNANAAFDYARDFSSVRSPLEFLAVMTEHARKGFDAVSGQTKELTALAQKVASDATEPLQAGVAKAFRGPLS
jgi:phasin